MECNDDGNYTPVKYELHFERPAWWFVRFPIDERPTIHHTAVDHRRTMQFVDSAIHSMVMFRSSVSNQQQSYGETVGYRRFMAWNAAKNGQTTVEDPYQYTPLWVIPGFLDIMGIRSRSPTWGCHGMSENNKHPNLMVDMTVVPTRIAVFFFSMFRAGRGIRLMNLSLLVISPVYFCSHYMDIPFQKRNIECTVACKKSGYPPANQSHGWKKNCFNDPARSPMKTYFNAWISS